MTYCHTYRPQPIEHVQVPLLRIIHRNARWSSQCEHNSQCPKTTKLVSQPLRRAIYLDPSVLATTSTLTPATLANPSSTQGFLVFICHPEPQLKRCYSEPQLKEYHVLNPYPEPQPKGYVLSHNTRNTNNPTFKAPLEAL